MVFTDEPALIEATTLKHLFVKQRPKCWILYAKMVGPSNVIAFNKSQLNCDQTFMSCVVGTSFYLKFGTYISHGNPTFPIYIVPLIGAENIQIFILAGFHQIWTVLLNAVLMPLFEHVLK